MAQDETVAALKQQRALCETESASRELVHSTCSEELPTKPYDSLYDAGHSNNARLTNDAFFDGHRYGGNHSTHDAAMQNMHPQCSAVTHSQHDQESGPPPLRREGAGEG